MFRDLILGEDGMLRDASDKEGGYVLASVLYQTRGQLMQ